MEEKEMEEIASYLKDINISLIIIALLGVFWTVILVFGILPIII